MKVKLHCFRHPGREAVAIFNSNYPVCRDCADASMIATLNAGEMLGIACRGVPQALAIPQKQNIN